MAPKMGILSRFKRLEYTKHSADSESEESLSVARLNMDILTFEDEFRRKSLEFIVHSFLVRID